MPKISRPALKSKFSATRSPKQALKVSVAAAMFIALGFTSLILVAGLFVPQSVLVKFSSDKSSANSGSSTADGISSSAPNGEKTVKQADGTTVTTTADGTIVTTAPDGTTKTTTATGTTTTSTAPATGGSTAPATGGGTTTPPATGGGTTPAAGVAPTLTFSGSPTSITTGASSTLSWSINGTATAPVTCTAGGGWSGAKATSGSQAVTPASTTSYTLVCTNSAGTSGTKTVSITVSAPVSNCKAGGTCSAADIAPHNTAANCWVGITGTGYNKTYIFTSSFNTSHISTAGKASNSSVRTCGKVISITTLKGFNGDHSNGAKIGANTFDQWLTSFYYANYQ